MWLTLRAKAQDALNLSGLGLISGFRGAHVGQQLGLTATCDLRILCLL